MKYDPRKHHRRSIRLKGYDYTQEGAYYVTICINKQLCLLGDVVEGKMILNDAGKMIWKWWDELNKKYESVHTDEAIVMPNHFHGIIFIDEKSNVGAALCGPPKRHRPSDEIKEVQSNILAEPPHTTGQPHNAREQPPHTTGQPHNAREQPPHTTGQPHRVAPTVSLFDTMEWFKTMTTNEYIRGVKKYNWKPFPGKFWQRNYYDRIIRNEDELNKIREYIIYNPEKWDLDRNNPKNWGKGN
ncbi:transposase [bacterium]